MKAGFAKVDITPSPGGQKIGWIKAIPIERILDPLYARVAILENDSGSQVAFIQTDTLSIRWTQVHDIRSRISVQYGFPGEAVLVAATHNHSGPAVASVGDVPRDDAYVADMTERIVSAFGRALEARCKVTIGFAHVSEFGLSHNRRTVLRDGTAITHGAGFSHPLALHVEGPIDPEVAVLAARDVDGRLVGAIINFACHPVHHGGEPVITAGFPGVLARKMATRGCPDVVFLNGACGNISPGNPMLGQQLSMGDIGRRLAEDAFEAMEAMTFSSDVVLESVSGTVDLRYRDYTEADVAGTAKGAQRFVDPAAYDRAMPALLDRIAERGIQPAEVQILRVGDVAFATVPAEFFVQPGLRIKEAAHPLHGLVVSHANGMVGYVPHREAFERGGYETTFGPAWRMAPDAADILVEEASGLLESLKQNMQSPSSTSDRPGIGIQLYTVRDLTDAHAFKATLLSLAAMGFEAVEFAWKYGGLELTALADFLKEIDLECCGMHVQLSELLDPAHEVYAIAAAVGTEFITTSLAGKTAEWQALLPQLNDAGRIARDHGLQLTYHNHWQEFEGPGDRHPMDILIQETDPDLVQLELDLGWIRKGGEDPLAYWRRHAARVPQIHLRDYDVEAQVDCDVGDGFLQLPPVQAQAREFGVRWLIYEQSTYPVDPMASCRRCSERLGLA